MERPEFIPFFRQVIDHADCSNLDTIVYGYIYWLTKLKNERCFASNETLAQLAGSSVTSVGNSLTALEKAGFIKRTYAGSKYGDRTEIIPLLSFGRLSPTNEGNPHPQVMAPSPTGEQSKSIELAQQTSELEIRVVEGKEDEDKPPKSRAKYPNAKTVFGWFGDLKQPSWAINTTELKYAELLFTRGKEQVTRALAFLNNYQDEEFIPKVTKPSDLEKKWTDLLAFKRKNHL